MVLLNKSSRRQHAALCTFEQLASTTEAADATPQELAEAIHTFVVDLKESDANIEVVTFDDMLIHNKHSAGYSLLQHMRKDLQRSAFEVIKEYLLGHDWLWDKHMKWFQHDKISEARRLKPIRDANWARRRVFMCFLFADKFILSAAEKKKLAEKQSESDKSAPVPPVARDRAFILHFVFTLLLRRIVEYI